MAPHNDERARGAADSFAGRIIRVAICVGLPAGRCIGIGGHEGLPRSHHRKPRMMVRDRGPARAIARRDRETAAGLEILPVRSRSGRWTLPKGHLEAGETPPEAAARESREEAGVEGDLDPCPSSGSGWREVR